MPPPIADLTTLSLAVILTFDLLTLKSNQSISVPNCTEVVNLMKNSHERLIRHRVNNLVLYDLGRTDAPLSHGQPENRIPPTTDNGEGI